MVILSYSTHLFYSPHIEAEIEIIQNHLDNADKVYKVVCNGDLNTCDMNQNHEFATCLKCRNNRKSAEKEINGDITLLPIIEQELITSLPDLNIYKSVDDLKTLYYKNFDVGYAIASSLISLQRNADFPIQKNTEVIKNYYLSATSVYETTLAYIDKFKPQKIYFFNGRLAHVRAVMRACEAKKTEFVIHERGCDQNHYELYPNAWPHSINYQVSQIIKYWNDPNTEAAEKIKIGSAFYETRKVGNPKDWHSFVKDQEAELLPEGFDKTKKNIVIYNSSLDEWAAINNEWKFPFFETQEEFISALLQLFENEPGFHFYLRVHPNLRNVINKQSERILKLDFKNLTVIPAESKISTYFLLDNCDKVISFGSTVGIEAVYWNKPSILVAPAFYDFNDSTYKANSYEQVKEQIKSDLPLKNKNGALMFGYYFMVHGKPYKHFKPKNLFEGTYNGVDLMRRQLALTRIILKTFNIPLLGKPIAIFAKAYQKKKLKLPFPL